MERNVCLNSKAVEICFSFRICTVVCSTTGLFFKLFCIFDKKLILF